MNEVSIVLTVEHCTDNNDIEVVVECEKEYNALALCCFSADIIKTAKKCGGKMIPWAHEPQQQKFCHAFRFETEEEKKDFLHKIFSLK